MMHTRTAYKKTKEPGRKNNNKKEEDVEEENKKEKEKDNTLLCIPLIPLPVCLRPSVTADRLSEVVSQVVASGNTLRRHRSFMMIQRVHLTGYPPSLPSPFLLSLL